MIDKNGVSLVGEDDEARSQLFDVPGRVMERLRAAFRAPDYQPPLLPSVAIELLHLSRKPDVKFRDVLALLEKDPLVAGKVLRAAQSVIYAPAGNIRSLHEALVRLGLERLTFVFLNVLTHMKVFRAPGYEKVMEELRRHSTVTAHIARLVCRHVTLYDEYAFLCGLLHDVGYAGGLIVLSSVEGGGAPPPLEKVWPSLVDLHEEAGGIISTLWRLPPDVRLVIAHHHHCFIGGHAHPVAAAVGLADWIATSLGAGVEGETTLQHPESEMHALGIDTPGLERIMEEAEVLVTIVD